MNEWAKDERREIADALIARTRFENAFDEATVAMTNDPPRRADDILRLWTNVLEKQQRFQHVIALRLRRDGDGLEAVTNPSRWSELSPWIPEREVESAVRGGHALRVPLGGDLAVGSLPGQLFVSPCPGVKPQTSFAAIVARARASLEQWMTQQAALSAALALAMLHSSEEREKGFRDMAARVSHMCASDLLLAQYRLRDLRKSDSLSERSLELVDKCIVDIEQAQRGFDRARLLGAEAPLDTRRISIVAFLRSLVTALGKTVGSSVADIAHDLPDRVVEASEIRLTYAIRDMILTLWAIGEPRRPVRIFGYSSSNCLYLVLDAERPNLPNGNGPSDDWETRLRDPSQFLVAPDGETAPERVLGIQLAWTLIEQIPGSGLSVVSSDHGLEMRIQLPTVTTEKAGAQ